MSGGRGRAASGRGRSAGRGHTVALAGGGSSEPVMELGAKDLRLVARRLMAAPIEIPRRQVLAVVDLRGPGAARTALTGPTPLRRPPASGALLSGGGRVVPSLAIVLREPLPVGAQAARRLGLKARKGQQATVDVIEVCPADTDEAVDALSAARYPSAPSVADALADALGTIDEPDVAAEVSAERERAVRRQGLTSMVTVALPIVVLAAVFVAAPGARGQTGLLLGLWIGIAVVLGASLRRTNARTLARLGPPPGWDDDEDDDDNDDEDGR